MNDGLENKILTSFKKKLDDVSNLNLLVSIPDDWEDCKECNILEDVDSGKVWFVKCDKNGNVKDWYEMT